MRMNSLLCGIEKKEYYEKNVTNSIGFCEYFLSYEMVKLLLLIVHLVIFSWPKPFLMSLVLPFLYGS